MCYGIKELVGKKTRESNVVQKPGSPEVVGYSKVETIVRAWLKKLGHKKSTHEKEKHLEWV